MAARRLFGSFRKGEANDPETYVAAVLTVLMDYPDEIVNEVCHPARGLPSRCDFLPTMKELKDACEGEAARVARLEKYAALPRSEFKRLPRREPAPGDLATIKVLPDTPQYARMVALIESKTAHERKWKRDEEGHIWVSFDLLDSPMPAKSGFKPFSDAELQARYAKAPPIEPEPATEGVEF